MDRRVAKEIAACEPTTPGPTFVLESIFSPKTRRDDGDTFLQSGAPADRAPDPFTIPAGERTRCGDRRADEDLDGGIEVDHGLSRISSQALPFCPVDQSEHQHERLLSPVGRVADPRAPSYSTVLVSKRSASIGE